MRRAGGALGGCWVCVWGVVVGGWCVVEKEVWERRGCRWVGWGVRGRVGGGVCRRGGRWWGGGCVGCVGGEQRSRAERGRKEREDRDVVRQI